MFWVGPVLVSRKENEKERFSEYFVSPSAIFILAVPYSLLTQLFRICRIKEKQEKRQIIFLNI